MANPVLADSKDAMTQDIVPRSEQVTSSCGSQKGSIECVETTTMLAEAAVNASEAQSTVAEQDCETSNADGISHFQVDAAAVVKAAEMDGHQHAVTLQFSSWEDLQCQLVLLPHVEEEGIGAVVASCESLPSVTGLVLECLGEHRLYDAEFSDILATLRGAPSPLVLRFVSPQYQARSLSSSSVSTGSAPADQATQSRGSNSNSSTPCRNRRVKDLEEEKKSDEYLDRMGDAAATNVISNGDARDVSDSSIDIEEDTSAPTTATLPPAVSTSLFQWTTRMRETSALFAVEAASLSTAVANRAATAAKQRPFLSAAVSSLSSPTPPVVKRTDISQYNINLNLFLQTTSGAFLPVTVASEITNSSLLTVRISPSQPCQRGYFFQWYRKSAIAKNRNTGVASAASSIRNTKDDASITSNSHRSMSSLGSPNQPNASCASQTSRHNGWTLLPGATYAAFQPSATEVGHYLQCIVTVEDEDDSSEDEPVSIVCETPTTVSAATALVLSARQALTRGAVFAGLFGNGKAANRNFRLTIERSIKSQCTVTIFQVSGSTAEPLHPVSEPVPCLSAISDYTNPKCFELLLSLESDSHSFVAALCTDNKLQLQAPNRLARESILLATGIANFMGELTVHSVLFDSNKIGQHSQRDGVQQVAPTIPTAVTTSTMRSSLVDDASSSSSASSQSSCRSSIPLPARPKLLKRSVSLDQLSPLRLQQHLVAEVDDEVDPDRVMDLERELELLKLKLARKDQTIAEQQRAHASQAELHSKTLQRLAHVRDELTASRAEKAEITQTLRGAEIRLEALQDEMKRAKGDAAVQLQNLQSVSCIQQERVAELEKTMRTLKNEKAVLQAAVEARDGKLAKLADLQEANEALQREVEKHSGLQVLLDKTIRQYQDCNQELQSAHKSHDAMAQQVTNLQEQVLSLQVQLHAEQQKTALCRTEIESHQLTVQKLISERNSYKQKSESLKQELGKVCGGRTNRTIADVEQILAEDASRKQELIHVQKELSAAVANAQRYRTLYERACLEHEQFTTAAAAAATAVSASNTVGSKPGQNHDMIGLRQRNAELERVVADLTEYVQAKEMQLETCKAVHQELQAEISELQQLLLKNKRNST